MAIHALLICLALSLESCDAPLNSCDSINQGHELLHDPPAGESDSSGV
jgi:hypothetical protein